MTIQNPNWISPSRKPPAISLRPLPVPVSDALLRERPRPCRAGERSNGRLMPKSVICAGFRPLRVRLTERGFSFNPTHSRNRQSSPSRTGQTRGRVAQRLRQALHEYFRSFTIICILRSRVAPAARPPVLTRGAHDCRRLWEVSEFVPELDPYSYVLIPPRPISPVRRKMDRQMGRGRCL